MLLMPMMLFAAGLQGLVLMLMMFMMLTMLITTPD